ncbi:BZ3500_MvSof-1268-A1-R1_Chr2-2g05194 [Microbotryum saponariae]|uniref:BZ3500_MvSof-1268-A1-R1_Chr2-2g05194 protein n=1 Tax=Microbotryum saponariae TaxID=289078 RepID=A0A2X0K8Z5_9BASI|nr:BZ3500_MvSof-1268-A1-R1_Chr2-2g05194 [Microbotryum saponariae]SDA01021.1 BZ3501_MvSof-1269-A2-R1_Chr2-2g04868 [Microbotryum saponariae]
MWGVTTLLRSRLSILVPCFCILHLPLLIISKTIPVKISIVLPAPSCSLSLALSLGRPKSRCSVVYSASSIVYFFYFTGAHKLQSFGLAGTATKRAKRGYKATTASNWVKVKPLRAKSAAQIKTRRAPNADSNGR